MKLALAVHKDEKSGLSQETEEVWRAGIGCRMGDQGALDHREGHGSQCKTLKWHCPVHVCTDSGGSWWEFYGNWIEAIPLQPHRSAPHH